MMGQGLSNRDGVTSAVHVKLPHAFASKVRSIVTLSPEEEYVQSGIEQLHVVHWQTSSGCVFLVTSHCRTKGGQDHEGAAGGAAAPRQSA